MSSALEAVFQVWRDEYDFTGSWAWLSFPARVPVTRLVLVSYS